MKQQLMEAMQQLEAFKEEGRLWQQTADQAEQQLRQVQQELKQHTADAKAAVEVGFCGLGRVCGTSHSSAMTMIRLYICNGTSVAGLTVQSRVIRCWAVILVHCPAVLGLGGRSWW